jgi:hypothetical protein
MSSEWEAYLQHTTEDMAVERNYLDDALQSLPVEAIGDGSILRISGIVRQVLSGLRDQGVMVGSWAEVLRITLLVIDLVQTVGPQVIEIIGKVRELLNK